MTSESFVTHESNQSIPKWLEETVKLEIKISNAIFPLALKLLIIYLIMFSAIKHFE